MIAARPDAITTWGKKVLVVMPWQKQVSPITAFCTAQIMDRRRTASMLHFGDAFVTHSRNSCADVFLASDLEWMLTIDDDMVVPFGHKEWFKQNTGFAFPEPFMSFNALDRLMSHGKSLVGALYFGRHMSGPPVYAEGAIPTEAAYARKGPYDLCKPTKWVGTGCMLIHRRVYEDIEKRFPRLARDGAGKHGQWFTSTEASLLQEVILIRDKLADGKLTPEKAYEAFRGLEEAIAHARADNGLGVGEDVSFCMRAKAAGHQPYVDMGLICGHLGVCAYGPRNTGNVCPA